MAALARASVPRPSRQFPEIQILTVEGLLSGAEAPKFIDLSQGELSFKKAKAEKIVGEQQELF